MKEEALKLADELFILGLINAQDMIRKLVAKIEVTERDYNFMYSYAKGLEQVEKDLKTKLNKQTEPLNDKEIMDVIEGTWWVGTEEQIRFKIARAIEERILGK